VCENENSKKIRQVWETNKKRDGSTNLIVIVKASWLFEALKMGCLPDHKSFVFQFENEKTE